MDFFKIIRWGLCLLAACSFGCAAVNVDVGSTIDWSKVSTVTLQPPTEDPWQLAPEIRNELQQTGFTVLATNDTSADLLVRYFTKEGPDLNSDGDLLTRLKSFHVQFVDPATNENVAVVDYFYADTMADPADDSVSLAFAELRRDIQAGRSVTTPAAPTQVAAPEPAPAVAEPSQPQVEATTPQQDPQPAQVAPAEITVQPAVTPNEAPAVAEQTAVSVTPAVIPTIEKEEARKITPRTESPWVPRFHSWGFEDWGDDETVDDY